ncbi:hypothetical protein [Rubritalea tangerina]
MQKRACNRRRIRAVSRRTAKATKIPEREAGATNSRSGSSSAW